jgi:type I restriction enzyme R subunit
MSVRREVPKHRRVKTDFKLRRARQDELGAATTIDLPGLGVTDSPEFEQFKKKALQFWQAHEDNPSIRKLRLNQVLSATDLGELERVLLSEGVGTPGDIERAKKESNGLGLFIRSLVGLDREAAKRAFGQFLEGQAATANQIEFVNLIIEYLTEHSVMSPALLYASPFTDMSPTGPEGVSTQIDAMIGVLRSIRLSAAA